MDEVQPEPRRCYTRWQRLLTETVSIIETRETLLDRRSVDVLKSLARWRALKEGRWVALYYPRDQIELVCGLLPEATRMPGKDQIVEAEPICRY